jgi:hypothetical protein
MPVILGTQEAEMRRMVVRSQQGQTVQEFRRHYFKNTQHKNGLVEWLKV